jgi:hypothetical protein
MRRPSFHYRFRSQEKASFSALAPFCGFLVCVFIWLNLNLETKLLGAAWVGVGLLLYLVMRKQKASGGVV